MNLKGKLEKAQEAGEDQFRMYYRLPVDTELIERILSKLNEKKWNMPTLITEAIKEFVK